MIRIFDDLEALGRAAADRFVELARDAVAKRGRFVVALAGGGTPRRTYELLAEPCRRNNIAWEVINVFWGDERHVPPDDGRNNAHMARTALLNHVPLPREQIRPVPYLGSAEESARHYETELRNFFDGHEPRFDLVFLGLGENGHTASLFPCTPALEETDAWVVAVHPADDDLDRVTLTAPVLNQAVAVIFLVAGESKATVLCRVLEGPTDPRHYPAQLIHPLNGELDYYLDRKAASRLKPGHATTA